MGRTQGIEASRGPVKRYRLSPLAEFDLEEIWLYVAQDNGVGAADRLIDQITRRFALLATHPDAGRSRDDNSLQTG